MQLMEGAEEGEEPGEEKPDPTESGNEDPPQTQNEVAPSTPTPATGPAPQQVTPDPTLPEEEAAAGEVPDVQQGEGADAGTREQTQDSQQTSS